MVSWTKSLVPLKIIRFNFNQTINYTNQVIKMLRRIPTRTELKMEDIQDFKQKKDEHDRKNESKNILGSSLNVVDSGGKVSQDTIHQRIGYDPRPKMN
jgi:hypothetical protein